MGRVPPSCHRAKGLRPLVLPLLEEVFPIPRQWFWRHQNQPNRMGSHTFTTLILNPKHHRQDLSRPYAHQSLRLSTPQKQQSSQLPIRTVLNLGFSANQIVEEPFEPAPQPRLVALGFRNQIVDETKHRRSLVSHGRR